MVNIILRSGWISLHLRLHKLFQCFLHWIWITGSGGRLKRQINNLISGFPTSTSSYEGSKIGSRKGGGQGTKGLVGSSSKIRGVS